MFSRIEELIKENEAVEIAYTVDKEKEIKALPCPAKYDILAGKLVDDTLFVPKAMDDIGQAEAFVNVYGEQLSYSTASGYMAYDGSVWNANEVEAKGVHCLFLNKQKQVAENRLESCLQKCEEEGCVPNAGKAVLATYNDKQKQILAEYKRAVDFLNFVNKYRTNAKIEAVMNVVQSYVNKEYSCFDADPYLLNTPLGTYDIRNYSDVHSCKKHDSNDFITKKTIKSPESDNEVSMKIWENALSVVFGNDTELIEFLQLVFGSALIGKVTEEKLYMFYGSGKNGKSSIINAIYRVLGTYSGNISPEVLTTQCRYNAKFEFAMLKGKRLVLASELGHSTILNGSVVKKICSTDDIYAELKFKDGFSFKPTHTTILLSNFQPTVVEVDNGLWRRICLIPVKTVISDAVDIKNYADILVDKAGGAILHWLLLGAKKYIDMGYNIKIPVSIKEANAEYRHTSDSVSMFVEDALERNVDNKLPANKLFAYYKQWCEYQGEYAQNSIDFSNAIANLGFKKTRNNRGYFYNGLAYKDSLTA